MKSLIIYPCRPGARTHNTIIASRSCESEAESVYKKKRNGQGKLAPSALDATRFRRQKKARTRCLHTQKHSLESFVVVKSILSGAGLSVLRVAGHVVVLLCVGIGGLEGRGRLVTLLLFHFRSVLKRHARLECETKHAAASNKQSEGSTAILRIRKRESSSPFDYRAASGAWWMENGNPCFRWGKGRAGGGEHNKGLLPNQVEGREGVLRSRQKISARTMRRCTPAWAARGEAGNMWKKVQVENNALSRCIAWAVPQHTIILPLGCIKAPFCGRALPLSKHCTCCLLIEQEKRGRFNSGSAFHRASWWKSSEFDTAFNCGRRLNWALSAWDLMLL